MREIFLNGNTRDHMASNLISAGHAVGAAVVKESVNSYFKTHRFKESKTWRDQHSCAHTHTSTKCLDFQV